MATLENITALFQKTNLNCTDFSLEKESQEYEACNFKLNAVSIHYRQAKITPKKEGQFVTFWKRIPSGIIAPFDETDAFELLIVAVETEKEWGYFIFPKSVLVDRKIVSTLAKEGKRAFRIYPPWSLPKNKQALSSQKWQLLHYVDKDMLTDFLSNRLISAPIKTT